FVGCLLYAVFTAAMVLSRPLLFALPDALPICLVCYRRIADPPGPIDRATVYVPPSRGVQVMRDLAARGDVAEVWLNPGAESPEVDRKSTRLNSSHVKISYAVFCLKKKKSTAKS